MIFTIGHLTVARMFSGGGRTENIKVQGTDRMMVPPQLLLWYSRIDRVRNTGKERTTSRHNARGFRVTYGYEWVTFDRRNIHWGRPSISQEGGASSVQTLLGP